MATRFLKILSNGNKIFKNLVKTHMARYDKLTTAPSYIIIFNFSFPFSIGNPVPSPMNFVSQKELNPYGVP